MRINHRACGWVLAVACAGSAFAGETGKADSTAARYGFETLKKIHAGFYMPEKHLYAEETNITKKPAPSWIWDGSIELGALCSAAKLDPKTYLPQVREYATALRSYRTMNHDKPGFDVNPAPKPPDRYFDDNAWISMSLLETYELTHDEKDLQLAKECYEFAIGSEDDKLGGGLYWHEDRPTSKNACTSGPAMLAGLHLYRLTKDEKYLTTVKRLYEWQCKTLQDKDGLVFDNITVPDGKINRGKLTYNSGTLIRAGVELYQATNDKKYLDEAERDASAAAKRFVRKNGMIEGWGKLAVKLVEAWAELAEVDHNDQWKQIIGKSLSELHEKKNADGYYALDWDKDPLKDKAVARLIDQAAVARAYLIAAEHGIEVK